MDLSEVFRTIEAALPKQVRLRAFTVNTWAQGHYGINITLWDPARGESHSHFLEFEKISGESFLPAVTRFVKTLYPTAA